MQLKWSENGAIFFAPRVFFVQWRGKNDAPPEHFLIQKTLHRTCHTDQNHTDEHTGPLGFFPRGYSAKERGKNHPVGNQAHQSNRTA